MHSDSEKGSGSRYASATSLFAAGDVRRYMHSNSIYCLAKNMFINFILEIIGVRVR